jgi:hypothetical protein
MRKYALLLLLLLCGCVLVDESPNRCYHLWDPSQKDNCLLMVATQTMNISKCTEINRTDIAEQCYSTLLSKGAFANISTCESMSGVRKDDCFSQLAASKNDTSLCMRINFSYQRDNCISKIAIAHDAPSMCDPISINASRDLCKNQIYEELAIKNKDTAYCKLLIAENASNTDLVDKCIFTLAKRLNDTSYCSQITNVFSKELCQTGRIDPASCNLIADAQGRQACLYISAVYSNDASQCATMPSESMRNNCYIQVAKNTNDQRICSFISSSDLRSQCAQIVQSQVPS